MIFIVYFSFGKGFFFFFATPCKLTLRFESIVSDGCSFGTVSGNLSEVPEGKQDCRPA
jgi:hypothetical protein